MLLNNIIKVERIVTANLDAVMVSLDEVILGSNNVFSPVNCITPVSVENTSRRDAKTISYVTKMILQLKPNELWNGATGYYAFRITCVDGAQYLIGSPSRPFTRITSSDVHPDKASGAQGKTVTVEYTSSFGMLKIRQ